MHDLISLESLIALITLTLLEIVLGIDNIVMLAILAGKLDPSVQEKARRIGLALAMVMRIALLLTISWFIGLTQPLFELLDHTFSLRDLILIAGGLFLIAKATSEVHDKLEGGKEERLSAKAAAAFSVVILQIVLMDLVFSLDSVLTAIGMARHIAVMVVAIMIAVGVMMLFAGTVARITDRHPTFKMLALAFMLLIGVVLVADGLGREIERGYIYFALGFSLIVEMLNLRARRTSRGTSAP